jgi:ribose 5-phosphate isomerase B
MNIAIGSDSKSHLTDMVISVTKSKGYRVKLFGALNDQDTLWPQVGHEVAKEVASGAVSQGILFCWTGTGISMAANKVCGIRAALCQDSETARGARVWNDANILVLSLRALSEEICKEILEAWFHTKASEKPEDRECFRYLEMLDRK